MKNALTFRLLVLLVGGILLTSLSGCMKDKDQDRIPEAIVTMVNGLISPANGVQYVVDNNPIQYAQSPLTYQGYDWFRLFAGNRRIRIFTNAEQPLVDETFTFKDSTYYTSFIYGRQQEPHHLLTEDKMLNNLGDQSALRFFHLSPSEGKVNVYLDNKETVLYAERGYEGENEAEQNENIVFVARSSGKHTIIVTDEEDETLAEREYTFEAGRYYSLVLIGDGSTARPLYLGVVPQYK